VEWGYLVARKYGLLTEWVMTGEGPKKLEDVGGDRHEHANQNVTTGIIEEWVQHVRKTEGHDGRIVASLMRDSADFRAWFDEKERRLKAEVA